MTAGEQIKSALQLTLSERLGHRTIGQLAFGPHQDRLVLAALSIHGTAEERAAARRVLNAIALVGQDPPEDEVAVHRARRATRSRR